LCLSHAVLAAYFLGYLAAPFLGNIFGGIIFEMGRRQIFQLNKAAELTFTKNLAAPLPCKK